jgi:hypothetical protein
VGTSSVAELVREGEYWTFAFEGRQVRIRDSKGIGYLAELLVRPGAPIDAVELVAARSGGTAVAPAQAIAAGLSVAADSDLGAPLDEPAKRAYDQRLRDLREEIEEAEAFHDPERVARAREEYAAIAEQLAAATGLGGRDRRMGSTAERARLNVTRALKAAIARIAEHDEPLGQHLSRSVQTGRECVYRPHGDRSVRWQVMARGATAAVTGDRDPDRDERASDAANVPLPLPPRLADEAQHPFFGRDQPLDWLTERLRAARSGDARVALVAGEAGIGKTNLIAQLAARAHDQGTTVLYGACEEEALLPFQPWVQALDRYALECPRELLREQLSASGGELARLLPALRRRLPDLPQPASGDAVAERYWLFESVREFLIRATHARPLLVVLDDLHWADKPTTLLLKHLARARIDVPLLTVGAYREVEVGSEHPLAEATLALRHEGLADRLRLEGLAEAEVGEMITAWAGSDVPAAVVRELRNRTEGHPFFLREILRSLGDSTGDSERSPGLSALRTVDAAGVPESVKEVVGDRLRRLGPGARRVLGMAAVIGPEFDVDVLRRVSEVDEPELFDQLEQAASAQVITEAPGRATSYMFAHALVRDTLYDELTGPHRRRLHERIARAYEAGDDTDRELHLGELAHHYFQAAIAGDVLAKAADYAARAGDQAAGQLAYEEAAVHYEHASRALAFSGADQDRRCRVLLAQGENLRHAGEFRLAEAVFHEAAELAERLELAEELARAALGLSGELGNSVAVHDPALVALMERALALLPDESTPLRARLLIRLSEAIAFSPRRTEAKSLAAQAIEMARRINEPATLAEVLSASQQACRDSDSIVAQLEAVRECEQLARASGSTAALVESLWWQMAALAELGELEQAWAVSKKMTPLAEQLRQPYYSWMDAVPKAMFAFLDKPVDEIEPLIWHAAELGRQVESRIALTFMSIQIAVLRMIQGRHAEVRAATEAFADAVPGAPGYRCALAMLLCELRREADARRELERLSANDFADLPRDYVWLTCTEWLADTCAHLNEQRRAAILYEQLLPYADRYVVVGHFGVPLGSVHRPLARLAATCGDRDLACAHFETALTRDEKTGSPYAVAKCKYEYAVVLLDSPAAGERKRADELLRDARESATRFGMAALEAKVSALRRRPTPIASKPQRLRERAAIAASDAKAAVTVRGRSLVGRAIGDMSDAELERRFGSPLAQRALLTAMAKAFQPRLAFGFEGEIAIELEHPTPPGQATPGGGPRESDWWTLRVRRGKASATHGAATNPAVTIHAPVPVFVRLASGLDTPAAAALWYRSRAEGDLVLGARMTEMFGAVNPADVLTGAR